MASIALDRTRYTLAKAILAREYPSKKQEARFKCTKNLTLAFFAFGLLWVAMAVSGSTSQRTFLIVAMACYLAAVGLFLSNLSILRRLWRTWAIARQLGYSRPRVLRSRAPVIERLKNLTLLALYVPGLIITFMSSLGLKDGIQEGRWAVAAFAATSVVFGFMCLLMYPMARVRERLLAIAALQANLDTAAAEASSTSIEIHPAVWDDLAEIERLQIEADRLEVVAARDGHDSRVTELYISASFFEALAALDAQQADLVRRVLDELSSDSRPRDPTAARARSTESVAVRATNLSIEIRRYGSGRGFEVLALRSGQTVERGRRV